MTVDGGKFRAALSQYPTGVSVVAVPVAGGFHGMTAGSFTSVSLDPPLVLFCVGKRARLAALIRLDSPFSVNVLRVESQALSTYFAGSWKERVPPPHRFVPWAGVPRLEDAALALACRTTALIEAGDHWVVIGEVVDLHLGLAPRDPLVFFDRRYHRVAAGGGDAPAELEPPDPPAQLFHEAW
jgi:flavin reductase (DIM6/NTAB) family NADH-FMN oxidoreductase RutF